MSNMHTHLDAARKAELAQDPAEHPRRAHPVQTAYPALRALSTAEAAFSRYAAHHLRQAGKPGEDAAKRRQQAAENADLAQTMREGIIAHFAQRHDPGAALRSALLAAADRHTIYHTLRPLDSVLTDVLEAERRAGWAEGAPERPERQPLTDSAWLKRWTKDFCERIKPGPRRNEVLGIIRFCERHHGIKGSKEGGAA